MSDQPEKTEGVTNPLSSENDDWTGDPEEDRRRLTARIKRATGGSAE